MYPSINFFEAEAHVHFFLCIPGKRFIRCQTYILNDNQFPCRGGGVFIFSLSLSLLLFYFLCACVCVCVHVFFFCYCFFGRCLILNIVFSLFVFSQRLWAQGHMGKGEHLCFNTKHKAMTCIRGLIRHALLFPWQDKG